jgi:oligopeptidase B
VFHGDRVLDPYEWLRDGESPRVQAHLEAENAYAEERTSHLAPLRAAIFSEIKSRVKETDLSVPVADGPWWYYGRTIEGKSYGLHCRAPRAVHAERPNLAADRPIEGEEVLLDGNVEAGDSEFFSVGALGAIAPDHNRLAFATDTTGDERFDLTVRDLSTGQVLDDRIRGIGYGVVFSTDGQWLFYTRLDDAWRPFQVWRHRVGADPAGDVLVHQEDDERFLDGSWEQPRRALAHALARHQDHQ